MLERIQFSHICTCFCWVLGVRCVFCDIWSCRFFFWQHHSLNKCGKTEHFHFWDCLSKPLNLPSGCSFSQVFATLKPGSSRYDVFCCFFWEQIFYTCGKSWQIHFLFKCSTEFGVWFTGLPKIYQWLKWFQLMEKLIYIYILVPRSGEN